jgi:carbamoyl-phosphate synthase small subunit
MRAHLILKDGTVFMGRSPLGFGGSGELVFHASMIGYQEVLTDPSFFGQLVAMAFPEQGICGIHDDLHESGRPWANGMICRRLTSTPDHVFSETDVGTWLKRHRVPVMTELDTRALAHCLRSRGSQPAIIWVESDGSLDAGVMKAAELQGLERQPLCAEVSCRERWEQPSPNGKLRVSVLDGGIKASALRRMQDVGLCLEIFPWDTPANELLAPRFDGVFLGGGPGDPAAPQSMHREIAELIGKKPIFGLGLGHGLLAHAMGGGTFKMPFGHRGSNHPVVCSETSRVEITAQNHGFAVAEEALPCELAVTHRHLSDGTVEGMKHSALPIFSLEFIPRAGGGRQGMMGAFESFAEMMDR